MSAVLEARAVIIGEDRTGKAFDALKARIADITKRAEVMNRALDTVGAVSKNVEAFKLPPSASTDMGRFVETTERVGKAMADVNRSAVTMAGNVGKTSAEVVGLSARLMDVGAKLKGISDFKSTSRGVKDAALVAARAQQDARILAAKIDGSPSPTKSLQAAHVNALGEVREAERALEKQVATAAAARTTLGELGVPVNRLASEEERLKSILDGTNAALLRQIELERQDAAAAEKAAAAQRLSADQERRHHDALVKRFAAEDAARHGGTGHAGGHDHGIVNYALTSAAMAVSAHEIASTIGEAWHQGAELQHERIGLVNAGRTPQEVQAIEAAARNVVATLPTANFTDSMKVVAETTSAFGSVEHAIDNLPFMMKTMSVLKAAGGEHIHGSAGDVGRALAKTFEERQTRPEDFEKEASAMIPAMVMSGGTFNPEQLYAFAQQAKSALPSLSMRFLSRIAPSLIGAQGGERAGTALNAFENVISGKANDKKQAEEWMRLGLLDPSKVITKNGQATSWKSGAVKDTFLAMTDPLAWSEKYLIPALQKQGVDTNNREAVKQILDTMFRNQNANVFASEITQAASRARLHKDEDLINRVGDEDGIYQRNLADFGVAAGALKDALGNLAAAATAPMMRATAGSLSSLAAILNNVARFGFEHPTIAAGAGVTAAGGALAATGWLGKMLFDGFGLKGSAVALDAAAAHLMEVGAGPGGGPWNKVPKGAVVPGSAIPEALAIPGAVEVGSAVVAGAIAAGVVETVKKSFEAQEPGKGGLYAPATIATEDTDRANLADWQAERDAAAKRVADQKALEKIPGTFDAATFADRTRIAQLDAAIARLMSSLDGLHAYHDREAERGRGYLTLPRPDDMPTPYIDREAERGRAFASAPKLGDGDLPYVDREAARGRAYTNVPAAGTPVPVAIVSAPPAFHDGWLDGERQAIEERSRRGAALFRQDPEGTRGNAMMERFGPVSNIHATVEGPITAEVSGEAQINVVVTVNPSGELLSAVASAKGAVVKLNSSSGGTSGAVGTSYPQTAPTGRQMGPR